MLPTADFWRGKRVLVTGHTGFKGGWLTLWLARLGAQVTGLSLAPAGAPNLFAAADVAAACESVVCDIRDADALAAQVRRVRPEIVIHLAAQALVRASYRDPLATFSTNVMGTAHLLDALRGESGVCAAVIVTTDKVYRNHEWAYPYREDDALGGHDPYSASKAACEIVVASYRDAYLRAQGTAVATARAGNVIGGGDWSVDRLLPDAVRAWARGATLEIRNPSAVRPWQHVLEPLAGYLRLAECLWDDRAEAGAYNFGPATGEAATVGRVVSLAAESFGRGQWRGQADPDAPHEAGWLALEVARARVALQVEPHWGLDEAVRRTMDWYRGFDSGVEARALCEADIAAYEGSGAWVALASRGTARSASTLTCGARPGLQAGAARQPRAMPLESPGEPTTLSRVREREQSVSRVREGEKGRHPSQLPGAGDFLPLPRAGEGWGEGAPAASELVPEPTTP